MFKIFLISICYDLSDTDVEDMVNENLSAALFCHLILAYEVPDHRVLSRFRGELSAKGAFDELLAKLNNQLKAKGIPVSQGKAKVDVSLTDNLRKPKGRKTYELAQDRQEDDRSALDQEQKCHTHQLLCVEHPGIDHLGCWLKKRVQSHYGYKQHPRRGATKIF
ncbi:MAG: transposase [Ekhidna sp.]|nr:transposase [Ekhidna sp.]